MALKTAAQVALSLSGAGHLLPYHLAVCQKLIDTSKGGNFPPIHAISGSSSGAIAAVLASLLPNSIQDYAKQFIQDRGKGLQTLEDYLLTRGNDSSLTASDAKLHIATTRCRDGSLRIFSQQDFESDAEKLLQCVRASCTIPRSSFHPMDILASSNTLSYPDSDGILIQNEYLVDGGIAAPAPPVPDFDGPIIIVSPISGSSSFERYRISPKDSSFSIWKELKCRGDLYVRPSIQNLRALRVASGSTTSEELQSWYNLGTKDATEFVDEWEKLQE